MKYIFFFLTFSTYKMSVPVFRSLAERPDFQALVSDMLERSGLSEQDVSSLLRTPQGALRMDIFGEFAKCFVPQFVDPSDNYELYEFMGDSAVNKATISYLYRKLSKRLASSRNRQALGYLDKIKSTCVSTPFLADICTQLGFDKFLDWVISHNQGGYDSKKEKNYREDIVEAFFGCMEVHIDTLYMYRGYCFVSNIIVDILENIHINYHPNRIWTPWILLKETNDSICSAAKQTGAKLYTYTVNKYLDGYAIYTTLCNSASRPSPELTLCTSSDSKAVAEDALAKIALEYLSTIREYRHLVKHPPTPAELGIADLV